MTSTIKKAVVAVSVLAVLTGLYLGYTNYKSNLPTEKPTSEYLTVREVIQSRGIVALMFHEGNINEQSLVFQMKALCDTSTRRDSKMGQALTNFIYNDKTREFQDLLYSAGDKINCDAY